MVLSSTSIPHQNWDFASRHLSPIFPSSRVPESRQPKQDPMATFTQDSGPASGTGGEVKESTTTPSVAVEAVADSVPASGTGGEVKESTTTPSVAVDEAAQRQRDANTLLRIRPGVENVAGPVWALSKGWFRLGFKCKWRERWLDVSRDDFFKRAYGVTDPYCGIAFLSLPLAANKDGPSRFANGKKLIKTFERDDIRPLNHFTVVVTDPAKMKFIPRKGGAPPGLHPFEVHIYRDNLTLHTDLSTTEFTWYVQKGDDLNDSYSKCTTHSFAAATLEERDYFIDGLRTRVAQVHNTCTEVQTSCSPGLWKCYRYLLAVFQGGTNTLPSVTPLGWYCLRIKLLCVDKYFDNRDRLLVLVKQCLACGADVNGAVWLLPSSAVGVTAMEIATWAGATDLQELLLQHGATSVATVPEVLDGFEIRKADAKSQGGGDAGTLTGIVLAAVLSS
jgi:hypothetical protein